MGLVRLPVRETLVAVASRIPDLAKCFATSAYGTKRKCQLIRRMSAIGGKADVTRTSRYVR